MSFARSFAPSMRLAARPRALALPSTSSAVRAFTTSRVNAVQDSKKSQSYIQGTVNEPTTFPPPSKAHGSYHWTFERLLSASLVPLVVSTAVASSNPVIDGMLSVALVAHSHIGFDACLVDYLHPRKFPTLGPIAKWILRFATGGALVGLYQFNTNDIGLTELLKKLWKA